MLLFGTGDLAPAKAVGVKGQVRVKLIEVPLSEASIGPDELQAGRLPAAGSNEILSGAKAEAHGTLIVGGNSLSVVGILRPGVALFANAFLIPPSASNDKLFPAAVPTVFPCALIRASDENLRDARWQESLERDFPSSEYARITTQEELDRRTFYLYLSGLAIFFVGGSGAFIALWRSLAVRSAGRGLSGPLLEVSARTRLVWFVHLFYFGLVIAGALLSSLEPDAQVVLLAKIRELLRAKGSPLGMMGESYASGNVPLLAALILAFNFIVGALISITLPSIVIPGIGLVLAGVRALLWGLVLAPLSQAMALVMLPHAVTTLVEGEGYILATFFGLLIPSYVVRRRLGGNLFTRFGRAIVLNFKAQFWIALVLGGAAVFEAAELILFNRS